MLLLHNIALIICASSLQQQPTNSTLNTFAFSVAKINTNEIIRRVGKWNDPVLVGGGSVTETYMYQCVKQLLNANYYHALQIL